jgi:hypothetical protein
MQFVHEHFVPVRVHIRHQSAEYKRLSQRFGVQWTPTSLIVDAAGQERHRIEGFLPTDDFLDQLKIGRGHAAMAAGEFAEAAQIFSDVLRGNPDSDAAPEARYWYGVAQYKVTDDPNALAETSRDLQQRYADSAWAKKSSVWT